MNHELCLSNVYGCFTSMYGYEANIRKSFAPRDQKKKLDSLEMKTEKLMRATGICCLTVLFPYRSISSYWSAR